eukprot:CAMPEP_0202825216 /NCGR_PEP_ID=MMETSP1389-20130828/12882_1 /ASSEMBLY_ACC=CAM_ASM_000865 /TAXON_ID=302021 /ORGANISM="Rhodomonas sp., Strain CCMP768" /LENGTH=44 /DNA_ID= /DNA_START= /DNA_END= /DNA_ORIENTATION=
MHTATKFSDFSRNGTAAAAHMTMKRVIAGETTQWCLTGARTRAC